MHYAYIHKELNDVTIMRNPKNSFLSFVASSTAPLHPFLLPPSPLLPPIQPLYPKLCKGQTHKINFQFVVELFSASLYISRQKLKIVEDNEFFKIRQWPTNSENL